MAKNVKTLNHCLRVVYILYIDMFLSISSIFHVYLDVLKGCVLFASVHVYGSQYPQIA